MTDAGRRARLLELLRVFGLLGTIGFGGPAAHIALMRRELVERRAWLDDRRFVDLIGITNLLPGPNSTELAMHLGMLRAGVPGLVVAGTAFIVPSALMVLGLAAAYVAWGETPHVAAVLYGIGPVVVAIVAAAGWQLGRGVLAGPLQLALAAAVAILAIVGLNEIALLFAGTALYAVVRMGAAAGRARWLAAGIGLPAIGATAVAFSLPALFWAFLKIGALLYGSGYVLVSFLRGELVERLGWLTEQQVLDAVAVGQLTPGPLFTAATFVGYVLAGLPGAALATVAIFLPAFVLVALVSPLAARLRERSVTALLLDGVNAAALGLLAAVAAELARSAIVDALSAGLAVISLMLLLWRSVPSTWLIVAGGMTGLVALNVDLIAR